VDWEAVVYVNGQLCGTHRGGYTGFTVDATHALGGYGGAPTVAVRVWDPTDLGTQPRGKQVRYPHRIWYTSVTGIWQTCWLESVPAVNIAAVHTATDIATGEVAVTVTVHGATVGAAPRLGLEVRSGLAADAPLLLAPPPAVATAVRQADGSLELRATLALAAPRLWSPADPHLYALGVSLVGADGGAADAVGSYFGVRSVGVAPDADGVPRLLLNGAPIFMNGPLDQGCVRTVTHGTPHPSSTI
jgi:beta-galactosidase/beta-glucuronidase